MPNDDPSADTAASAGDALADTAAPDPGLEATAAATPGLDATAAASEPSAPRAPGPSGSLGRYRLERELGAGGMGVVHAAFDPDLERRVALKVLKGHTTEEARQRLLREARAMAKLGHPNVVTVYEVGNAAGRDFVAMELIDGGSLEHWLRAKPRSEREIIHAYLAAGRGLAAAHAAGLVHRDFKPHNVLRDASGRVAVTDFGLVVGVGTANELPASAGPVALSPSPTGATTGKTPSSLSGLTATGAVMGTPAYMAPEQWEGTTAGPATDQFAFCVALWEALAGERPYRGTTLDELHASLDRGPKAIDETKVPRRLRKILKRGLEPDPKRRWSSMDELLAAIARVERRTTVFVGLGSAVLLGTALVVYFASRTPARGCQPPIKNPREVWSTTIANQLGPAQRANAGALDRHMRSWEQIRGRTCKIDEEAKRAARLACLDGVLVRIDLITQAMLAVREHRRLDAADQLVDPADCERDRPPRLSLDASPARRNAMAAWLRAMHAPGAPSVRDADVQPVLATTTTAPCAAASMHLLAAFTHPAADARARDLDAAAREAKLCADDRVSAEVALHSAHWAIVDQHPDTDINARLQDAAAAVENLPDLAAELAMLHARVDSLHEDITSAISHEEHAVELESSAGEVTRQLVGGLELARLRQYRASPADVAGMDAELAGLAETARTTLDPDDALVLAIDQKRALWMFTHGDVEGADRLLAASHHPDPVDDPVRVTGQVVDERNAPVANATVAGGYLMVGDGLTVAAAQGSARFTTTDASGRFTLDDVPRTGVVIAQLADSRSRPVLADTSVTLALGPTSRVEGTVDLHGHAPTLVVVMVRDLTHRLGNSYWGIRVPVKADGSFSTTGVPRGHSVIQTVLNTPTGAITSGLELTISDPVVTGVHLEVSDSRRIVHVIARSTTATALANANVFVLPHRIPSTNMLEFSKQLANAQVKLAQSTADDNAPDVVRSQAKAGDLYTTIKTAPAGEISACVISYPPDAGDPRVRASLTRPDNQVKIPIACTTVDANAQVIVVDVPPWPRLD